MYNKLYYKYDYMNDITSLVEEQNFIRALWRMIRGDDRYIQYHTPIIEMHILHISVYDILSTITAKQCHNNNDIALSENVINEFFNILEEGYIEYVMVDKMVHEQLHLKDTKEEELLEGYNVVGDYDLFRKKYSKFLGTKVSDKLYHRHIL